MIADTNPEYRRAMRQSQFPKKGPRLWRDGRLVVAVAVFSAIVIATAGYIGMAGVAFSSKDDDTAAVVIPDPEHLPFGLHFSRRFGAGGGGSSSGIESETFSFVGDQALTVNVTMSGRFGGAYSGPGQGVQAAFGSIRLQTDDEGPWYAYWTGPRFQYTMMAYTPPYTASPAWSEADLAAFAEAFVAAQQTN